MDKDSSLLLDLEKLICWAESKNYFVDFVQNGQNCICVDSKIIEINSSASKKLQIIRLLHECGHLLIFQSNGVFDFKSKYSLDKESDEYKIFYLIEEVEAWRRALMLAKKLKINLDLKELDLDMTKALKAYAAWASK